MKVPCIFLLFFITMATVYGQPVPLTAPEAKVFVEAVDSIDFPTVTVYFRVLDLNSDTPYTLVDKNEVSIAENGSLR
jgi:hypothetical protein